MPYADSLTLREGRTQYFSDNGFGEDGYDDRWVKLKAGPLPLPIYFPNTEARVRAVKLHDLHHVLTGYETTWMGEAEIGAWEIAAGCGHHYAAWLLNLQALGIGLFLRPRKLFAAFRRGRACRSLYGEDFDEALLDRRIGEARRELGLQGTTPPNSSHSIAAFTAWAAASVLVVAGSTVLFLSPLWLLVLLLSQ